MVLFSLIGGQPYKASFMVVSILFLKCTSPLLAIELGSHICQIQCNLPLFQGELSGDLPAITS